MNITYIFGNGFDIQLGLATRYSHFLQEYVKPLDSDSENIRAFKRYLQDGTNRELWSDAERAMGEHLGEFGNDTLNEYSERVLDFESRMIEYLEREQKKCSFDKPDKIKAVFADFLRNSFEDVLVRRGQEIGVNSECITNRYSFLTFNYTNLLDRILECCGEADSVIGFRAIRNTRYLDRIGKVCHVHGALNSQIIMGVNDESQLNLDGGVTLSERLRRQLIKPALNAACRRNWDTDAQNLISESHVIVIYGVSYGATDAVWWTGIQGWLRNDKNHKLVAFIRDSGPQYNRKLPWQEIDYEEDKRRGVLLKLGVDPNSGVFAEMMEQTYVIVNTNRLNLKELLLEKPKETADDAAAAGSLEPVLSKT